ncbi:MAG: hypothetical protein M1832_001422 [Thelocarpon impressellum]|nr:MAG: hypothetical protein M1832_001422 [Thelocarpon impressellum]
MEPRAEEKVEVAVRVAVGGEEPVDEAVRVHEVDVPAAVVVAAALFQRREGEDLDGPTNVPGQVDPLTETTNEAATAKNGGDGATNLDASGKPRVPRERKQRGPPEDGVASKVKVMVANLPYNLSEEKLKELFVDYQPGSAKIALRPIPRYMVKKLQARNEPRKGRGFGFVTLASEEMQQKAVAEMNGTIIEGREIAVKVAIDSPGKEDEDINAPSAEEGAAPANGENGVAEGETGTTTTAPPAAAVA